ncbi:hypothetical protein [Actinomadura hibisca]|uniref:hypothetical protein n=1 Tax=Actinomadura hibisca TaxID=68565 RepID=UPI00082AC697|nr:hypothetical protein [Actinomadura hibisca]
MRRIATLAVSTGLAMSCLTAVAATAADASTTRSWVTKDGWGSLEASGKYTRSSSGLAVSVYLSDSGNNGWSPAVQIRTATQDYKKYKTSAVFYFVDRRNNRPADFKFHKVYRGKYTSGYSGHLYVREVGVRESNRNSMVAGPWKKLF